MATQKAPAPVTAIIQAGETPFDAIRREAARVAAIKRAVAPGSLKTPTEIGQGVIAHMDGTMLILAIETGDVARQNAEVTEKGAKIIAKAGPGFGRTMTLPGSDLGLALYVGLPAPKASK